MNTVRTRIAPSPTGDDLHIGNLYTALLNFAVAKKANGQFVIRIEDTDRIRYREGAERKILSSLKAFGLSYDEGPDIGGPYAPYRQSERLAIYKKYALELVEKGAAYYCICTKERLDALREQQTKEKKQTKYDKYCLIHKDEVKKKVEKGASYVIRLNVIPDKKMWFKDIIRGEISISSNEVDDQVLLKSDGYPTYHLGVVIDDHLMDITYIIRAEEWISSTPKHVLLYESFGWSQPFFAHGPILRNPDKSKLSKRRNAVWASWYLEEGFLPEAVLNYLGLMGWSHPEGKEIFSLEEFIRLFELKDVHTVGPVFDIQKLEWMNGVYIREVLTEAELIKRLEEFYKNDDEVSRILRDKESAALGLLINIAKTRMKTLKDFREFVTEPVKQDSYESEQVNLAKALSKELSGISEQNWKEENILGALKAFSEANKVSMKIAYILLTGKPQGLPLPQFLEYLKKDKSLARLNRFF